jgi:hypothetical protein
VAGLVSIVCFERQGREWYCVTAGRTLFESVRHAIQCFNYPFWRGPKPRADEIYSVSVVGDERKWKVRGERAGQITNLFAIDSLLMRWVRKMYWKVVERFNKLAYLNHRLESGDRESDPDGYAELAREIFVIETKKWTKRGMKVNVSVGDVAPPQKGNEPGPWLEGETGNFIEFDTFQKFKRSVEDREYERKRRKREAREAWIKWVTAGAAIVGAFGGLATLVNLYLTYHGKKP